MSTISNLVWVNKTRDSSSLSNCRSEKNTFSQIRSHALTVAHKSSRVKRLIKRQPLDLSWTRRNVRKSPTDGSWSQASSQQRGDNGPVTGGAVHFVTRPNESQSESRSRSFSLQRRRDSFPDTGEGNIFENALIIHRLSGIADPFSSYSIELDTAARDHLWYFENIWTQCAFKIPGCVGYGQEPIGQCEITAMIQQCLTSAIHSYCLLAATSARMRYLHHQEARNDGSGLAHGYATRALHGLRRRIQEHNGIKATSALSEEDATDILFLAAYEIFCSDEKGAETHLTAVRRLYKQEISNEFVKRLQANLELLATKRVAGVWPAHNR
jgi:hypothetical protein